MTRSTATNPHRAAMPEPSCHADDCTWISLLVHEKRPIIGDGSDRAGERWMPTLERHAGDDDAGQPARRAPLLALHDEKGSVIPAAARVLNGALIGAVLMEVGLLGRLRRT